MARDYNGDDSDTSMIRESSFKPAPNSTSTPKCNNKNTKSISKKLKIMCINCNSLRSVDKRAELNCLVNHHNPHVILGQESRLCPDIPSCEIFPKGFKSFRKDRIIGGGGVFILVREDIDHVEDAFPNDNKDYESVWVQLKLFNAKLLNIASFYRPPNSRNESLTLIHNDIGNTMKKYKHMQCVIGGDFNLPCFNWLEEEILDGPGKSKCDLFVNLMNDYGLSQHNKEISRPASNNILDLILTNNPSSVSHVYCTPGMSDHNAVICVLNILPQYKRQPKRTIFMYNKANWDNIRTKTKHLSKLYFNRNPDIYSVEDNCLFIQTSIENLIQTFVPSRLSKSKFHLPWITKHVRKQMKSRDKLYVKAIKSKSPQDWKRFKDARSKVKQNIRQSHRTYISEIVAASLNDSPKTFWSYIRALHREDTGIPTLRTSSGLPATSDCAKANVLNEQFKSVFTDEDMQNLPSCKKLFPDMTEINFDIDGIIKQLQKINPNKANGPDKVPARFLKETAMECGAMFHHLFCQSYQHGTLPSHWTHALVCPIYKKGKKSEPVNYRPVSLTAIPCKIMEHCIVSNIWSHLNKHSIITSKQHGFRRGMSCETQLIEATYDWTNILNKGKGQIDVILLDFSKAFDVVPHHRLLMKLYMYGITGKTHRWIEDFLGNRTQEVVVNGSKSECGMVKSGVPQGTVLGPLLFLIYINDIESQITSSISLFADDSALYRPIYSESDSLSLQEDIFKLQKWANTWQMAFNVNKCKLLRITYRKSSVIKYVYNMYQANALSDNSPLLALLARKHIGFTVSSTDFIHIEETQHESYLGVIIDNKLKFNQHIDDMSKKLPIC